jgi:hypothetical protein
VGGLRRDQHETTRVSNAGNGNRTKHTRNEDMWGHSSPSEAFGHLIEIYLDWGRLFSTEDQRLLISLFQNLGQ